jgi:hypothetical protein
MHDMGKDNWLQTARQTPPAFDTSPDKGLTWDQVTQRHWAFLDTNPAIKARYWADSDPINHYGLPMAYADEGNCFVIRAQRAIFQMWKVDVPWAQAGQVTIANAGDLAKESSLLPTTAVIPESSGGNLSQTIKSHDWQTAGFVSTVGGQLLDPQGKPLRSAGSNVPNMAYRGGLDQHLEWMRQHNMRWMRVFATGHALAPTYAPANSASAIAALRTLLERVDTFNAQLKASESIYVLISLTDYYPLGVPGDRYAFDHPTFAQSPVLPAPWFRAGTQQFNFDQEHNKGQLTGMPNYEVNYKPWVRDIVTNLSGSRSLMGWQLGNELKARGSPRNGISSDQAYDWYLAFTSDMVDTIRSVDQNHLIFTGAQYMAELTDWEYRPAKQLSPERVSAYRDYVQRMLNASGQYTWNVWSLTAYDFNPYAFDDATTYHQAGVAVVATEYGFTLGSAAQMQADYGGNRANATLNGLVRPWQTLDGQIQNKLPGVADLLNSNLFAAVAPWGSPAPSINVEFDIDVIRGITGTSDQDTMWAAWRQIGANAEAQNQASH